MAQGDVEERSIDGEYGQVYVNGTFQSNIQDFTGTASIAQQPLKVAGQVRQIYRRGLVTRNGSFTWLKVDSSLEGFFINGYLDLSPAQAQADRAAQGVPAGTNEPRFGDIKLQIHLNDPVAWGAEIIILNGVKMWTLPLGYGAAILTRSVSCTWDTEELSQGIPRPGMSATYAQDPVFASQGTTWLPAGTGAYPLI